MNFSLLAKIKSRRSIRAKLDEVAKIINACKEGHSSAALFVSTECAIITQDVDVLTGKSGSSRPFTNIAPKICALRDSARRVCANFDQKRAPVIHVRGESAMVSAYALGHHTLVAYTDITPGAHNLDAVLASVDRALGVEGDASKLVEQLTRLLEDI